MDQQPSQTQSQSTIIQAVGGPDFESFSYSNFMICAWIKYIWRFQRSR